MPWWSTAVIYQIYPRSFADADGDGMGDLRGVTSRLDHLVRLGVDAVWLSPFFTSPQKDAGYDVSDYRDVDPLFGTVDDFDEMLAAAHDRGLRVIVDLVPNHTSDAHAWFAEALVAEPGSPERDRYIFRPGRGADGSEPPNNWQSIFGGPAWTRESHGGEWYLHLFDSSQPDLNWNSPEVREEFADVLRFWLDRGVDGFRIDVAHGMVKAEGLPDWEGSVHMVGGEDPDLPASPMFDQEGVHEIYRDWHRVLAEYDGDRCLVAEAWVQPIQRLARYVRPDEMHQAFNFGFLTSEWTAESLTEVIDVSVQAMAEVGAPPTWVLSNHDVVRHVTRMGVSDVLGHHAGVRANDPQPDYELGLHRARGATLLMLGLPGSAYLYQGEELGLPDHTTLPDECRQDPAFARTGGEDAGRDGCRVPMPWSADEPAYGFNSTGKAWLPQPESYAACAAESQYGVDGSTFEMYRAALALRRELRLGAGELTWVDLGPEVFACRVADVTVVSNLGAEPVELPAGEVLIGSGPLEGGLLPSDTTVWLR